MPNFEKREPFKPESVEVTYDKDKRYMLEILKEVASRYNMEVEEIELLRPENETDESYKARKAQGNWSVRIQGPLHLFEKFWDEVREREKEYLEKEKQKKQE